MKRTEQELLAIDIGCVIATMLDCERDSGPQGIEEAAVFLVLGCDPQRYAIARRVMLNMEFVTLVNRCYHLTDKGREAGKIVNDEIERIENADRN